MKRMIKIVSILMATVLVARANNETLPEQNEDETIAIQIRVVSQLHDSYDDWNNAYYYPVDEFYYFGKAMEKSLSKIEGNYHFVFIRFPQKLDDSKFGITIYLHQWDQGPGGMINARFSARYQVEDEKGKIGTFSGSAIQTMSTIRRLRERQFEEAIINASQRFTKKLQPLLNQHFEKEAGIESS